jgi:hypothetical protein
VDNGAPEPIRCALVEGASWWNQAFEAAGFRNAFQVKVLPADADPMDVRYNMIKSLTGAQASAHAAGTRKDITRFLARPADPFKKTDPLPTPAGEPIGGRGGR